MSSKRQHPISDEGFIDHITHIVEDINVANEDLLGFGFLTSTKIETDQNKSSYIQIIFNEGFIKITDSPDYIFDNNKIPSIAALALETGKIEDVQGRLTLNGFHPMPLTDQKLSTIDPNGNLIDAEARLCRLRKSDMTEAYAEFIYHEPDKLIWSNPIPSHNNRIMALRDVIITSKNPDEATARYSWFSNKGSIKKIDELGWKIQLDRGNLAICESEALSSLIRSEILTETDGIAGYTVLSNDISATAKFFSDNKLDFVRINKSLLALPFPKSIGGCVFIGKDESVFPWSG
tara:strand:+ start:7450 stop:8322 length:873 start_codon:yes stop_codon:yes gene_type:complete